MYNGGFVDASTQPEIAVSSIQANINFTSPRQTTYTVLASSSNGKVKGYRKYSDQFTLNLEGQVPSYMLTGIENILKSAWGNKIKSKYMIFVFRSSQCNILLNILIPVNYIKPTYFINR